MPPGLKGLAAVPTEPIALSVLTGFLGSGKTTFLGRVLASPDLADTAVVISEFGAVALDHLLLETESEGIVDLPNGCTCCAVRQGLADTLYRLVDRRRDSGRPPFRRIALETSGLADPAPILYTLSADAYLEASLRLDRIVTTIDTIAGPASLARYPEATAQAASADLLVLTKTDLAPATPALLAHLAALNPTTGREIQTTRPAVVVRNDTSNEHSPTPIRRADKLRGADTAVARPCAGLQRDESEDRA